MSKSDKQATTCSGCGSKHVKRVNASTLPSGWTVDDIGWLRRGTEYACGRLCAEVLNAYYEYEIRQSLAMH